MKYEVKCCGCDKTFIKPGYKYNVTVKKNQNHFCNKACYLKDKSSKTEYKCVSCGKIFIRPKYRICKSSKRLYCTKICANHAKYRGGKFVNCEVCNKEIWRRPSALLKNIFCSRRCFGTFTAHHFLQNPESVSKPERYIQSRLKDKIGLDTHFNRRNLLPEKDGLISGLELDVYIPELKLGIELNGPFHYIPLGGSGRLEMQRRNDKRKIQLCESNGIHLVTISIMKIISCSEPHLIFLLDSIIQIITNHKDSNPWLVEYTISLKPMALHQL